eukprot:scaffold36918_cov54-Phaeocystis_antarctica.AAC.1
MQSVAFLYVALCTTGLTLRSDTYDAEHRIPERRRTEPDYQRLWGREPAALALSRGSSQKSGGRASPDHP